MSNSTTGEIQSTPVSDVDWEPPVPPTNLIFDDGEPLETNRHRIAMNALIRSMLVAMANRRDYFVGGNMFIYYSSRTFSGSCFKCGFLGAIHQPVILIGVSIYAEKPIICRVR
jgi:hypothetical protein